MLCCDLRFGLHFHLASGKETGAVLTSSSNCMYVKIIRLSLVVVGVGMLVWLNKMLCNQTAQ